MKHISNLLVFSTPRETTSHPWIEFNKSLMFILQTLHGHPESKHKIRYDALTGLSLYFECLVQIPGRMWPGFIGKVCYVPSLVMVPIIKW